MHAIVRDQSNLRLPRWDAEIDQDAPTKDDKNAEMLPLYDRMATACASESMRGGVQEEEEGEKAEWLCACGGDGCARVPYTPTPIACWSGSCTPVSTSSMKLALLWM